MRSESALTQCCVDTEEGEGVVWSGEAGDLGRKTLVHLKYITARSSSFVVSDSVTRLTRPTLSNGVAGQTNCTTNIQSTPHMLSVEQQVRLKAVEHVPTQSPH